VYRLPWQKPGILTSAFAAAAAVVAAAAAAAGEIPNFD
jgi:hypothetical protein